MKIVPMIVSTLRNYRPLNPQQRRRSQGERSPTAHNPPATYARGPGVTLHPLQKAHSRLQGTLPVLDRETLARDWRMNLEHVSFQPIAISRPSSSTGTRTPWLI